MSIVAYRGWKIPPPRLNSREHLDYIYDLSNRQNIPGPRVDIFGKSLGPNDLYLPDEDDPLFNKLDPILTSVHRQDAWWSPIFHADFSPVTNSYCGIYSCKEIPIEMGSVNWKHFTHQAYGEVELNNKVVEHEGGYRAETVIVRKIIIRDFYPYWPYRMFMSTDGFVKRLEDRYMCDVSVEYCDLFCPTDIAIEEDNIFIGRVNMGHGPTVIKIRADRIDINQDVEKYLVYGGKPRITIEGFQMIP